MLRFNGDVDDANDDNDDGVILRVNKKANKLECNQIPNSNS